MRDQTVQSILHQARTVVDGIAQQRLTWFGHVSRMESERLPVKPMRCSVIGRRNQGRQLKKWMENIKEHKKHTF